ncbi:MAG: hypothetical protein M0Q23_05660 [Syntrophales bacterium]|jgi:hypothetical protein|nr:hypothetical protein [Syntrophales bacterium]MCK9528120.1 hypothetical protein [Syntrophales bacterium]MDX9921089.1 hypothetical protein [Syntrophales bacterium]
MKIRVEKENIVQALRKSEGIEVVLENERDAKEALDLVFSGSDLFSQAEIELLSNVLVTEITEYKTSSVAYKVFYLLEFPFDETTPLRKRAALVRNVQSLLTAS